MKCPNCDRKIPKNYAACPNCGWAPPKEDVVGHDREAKTKLGWLWKNHKAWILVPLIALIFICGAVTISTNWIKGESGKMTMDYFISATDSSGASKLRISGFSNTDGKFSVAYSAAEHVFGTYTGGMSGIGKQVGTYDGEPICVLDNMSIDRTSPMRSGNFRIYYIWPEDETAHTGIWGICVVDSLGNNDTETYWMRINEDGTAKFGRSKDDFSQEGWSEDSGAVYDFKASEYVEGQGCTLTDGEYTVTVNIEGHDPVTLGE